MKPLFFATPADLRAWFEANHAAARELWVGFHKRATGRPSITWPESVDEALCCGWIDGIRKRLDENRYVIRFTPRKPASIWSANNIRRAHWLIEQGRMLPAGLAAFNARRENRSGVYSYEQRPRELPEPYTGILRKHESAARFFAEQPPGYRRTIAWWIVSAKKEETRLKRLQTLIDYCAAGRRIPMLTPVSPLKRSRTGTSPAAHASSRRGASLGAQRRTRIHAARQRRGQQ